MREAWGRVSRSSLLAPRPYSSLVTRHSSLQRRESMAEQPIRIGIVGAGGIVRYRHVPGLTQLAGVDIGAVSNSTPESTARAAREFEVPNQFADWRELVRSDGVDAVVIGTPPYMHREISCAALAAGKHVFCQARMALDYADAKAM